MKNIKLTIEYDGKGFGGWQRQPSKPNIQGEIENAIKLITRSRSRIKWLTAELMHGVHSLRASCKF